MKLHIICERDVGLFSMVQQVVANIPWALQCGRVPIAYFGKRTCYWTPAGYNGADTVWEYYFEPLIKAHPASVIPGRVRQQLEARPPTAAELGYAVDEDVFASAHYGDHPLLAGLTLPIPYLNADPSSDFRSKASNIIREFIRPKRDLVEKAESFFKSAMQGGELIGAHVRGTDAASAAEQRAYRQGSLSLPRYAEEIRKLLGNRPNAKIFVATDDEASLAYMRDHFAGRVLAYDSIRHNGGEAAAAGPTGWIMPAYIASDRNRAARNGEEAVIEYLLLSKCDYLVHNGSSLARTVLLNRPSMPHFNTHLLAQTGAAA